MCAKCVAAAKASQDNKYLFKNGYMYFTAVKICKILIFWTCIYFPYWMKLSTLFLYLRSLKLHFRHLKINFHCARNEINFNFGMLFRLLKWLFDTYIIFKNECRKQYDKARKDPLSDSINSSKNGKGLELRIVSEIPD